MSQELVLRGSVNEVQWTGEVANTAHSCCSRPHSDHSAEAISLSAAQVHQPVARPLGTLSQANCFLQVWLGVGGPVSGSSCGRDEELGSGFK